MKRIYLFLPLLLFTLYVQAQKLDQTVESRLKEFFQNYTTSYANIGTTRLQSIRLDNERRKLDIYPDANFGYQPFTNETVEAIYRSVKQSLPGPVNTTISPFMPTGNPLKNWYRMLYAKRTTEINHAFGIPSIIKESHG